MHLVAAGNLSAGDECESYLAPLGGQLTNSLDKLFNILDIRVIRTAGGSIVLELKVGPINVKYSFQSNISLALM